MRYSTPSLVGSINKKDVVTILSDNKDGILVLDFAPSFIIYDNEYEDDNFDIYRHK